MSTKELRTKSKEELLTLIEDLKAELFMLRFKNSTNQLNEVHKIPAVKKQIARVFTVLNSLETAAPATKPAPAKKAAAKPAAKKVEATKEAPAKAEATEETKEAK